MLKDAVSIPGISMTYVLNKSLKMKQPIEPELLAPGQPCGHKCTECEVNPKRGCEECKKVRNDCTQCAKSKPYELLKTGICCKTKCKLFSASIIVWKVSNLQ